MGLGKRVDALKQKRQVSARQTWHAIARRVIHFMLTGGVATASQLSTLYVLEAIGWLPTIANGVAFFVGAQVNFILSYCFTWRDRRIEGTRWHSVLGRWLAYHGAVIGTSWVNMGIFLLARPFLSSLPAAVLGSGCTGIVNFILGDTLVFRSWLSVPFATRLRHCMERVSEALAHIDGSILLCLGKIGACFRLFVGNSGDGKGSKSL